MITSISRQIQVFIYRYDLTQNIVTKVCKENASGENACCESKLQVAVRHAGLVEDETSELRFITAVIPII